MKKPTESKPEPTRAPRRPRTAKQIALADARYRDNEKLEKKYGRRFQAKALARLEKLIPRARKLKYGPLFMITYTLALCLDNQGDSTEATDAIGRARKRDMAEMRKLRRAAGRKKVAHAA